MSADSMASAAIARSTPATSVDGDDIKERNEAENLYSSALLSSSIEAIEAKDASVAQEAPPRAPITPPIAGSMLNPSVVEFSPKKLEDALVSLSMTS